MKGLTFSNDYLKLIFHGTTIANIAVNASSSPLTSLYISLHVGDPGTGGTQLSNEVSYTGYARVPILRSSSGWSVINNTVTPASNIVFGTPTTVTGQPVATYAVIGTSLSGSGKILYKMVLNPGIEIIVNKPPTILSNSTITEI
jgi:hypothetical protein